MNNIKSNINRVICFFLCILTFVGCQKEEKNSLSRYEGTYLLDSIHWTGLIVDFNGDGIGTRDMIREFSGYPGFVKEWIRGKVDILDDSTLLFDLVIPACLTNESMKQPDIEYYNMEMKAIWHNDWGIPEFGVDIFRPHKTDIGSGIERAVLCNIQESSFELHVECFLFTQESERIHGNMIYCFKKTPN